MLGIEELMTTFRRMILKNISMSKQFMKKKTNKSVIIVYLYVNDLIFTGNNPNMFHAFSKSMVKEFRMTNVGQMIEI